MYVITFGGWVCGDAIGNMCDLAHIWSHTQGGERYISKQRTHRKRYTHAALINLAVLAAAGPDFAPAKTDVGGSSTLVNLH